MQRRIRLSVLLACACLLALSLTALAVHSASAQSALPVPSPSKTPALSGEEGEGSFLVTVLDGYVAGYTPESDVPIETTDIRVSSLRLADQEMLRQGVVLKDRESLSRFLEDFGP
jgi:hypothetical protein